MRECDIIAANERLDEWKRTHSAEMRIIARQSAEIVRRINEEDKRPKPQKRRRGQNRTR